MNKQERKLLTVAAGVLGVLLVCSVVAQQNAQPNREVDVAVIVNPSNPVESVSSAELRKIFAGEKRNWAGGAPVSLFVRAPQAHERDVLLSRVLKMTESEYSAYWVQKVYSGEVQREPLALFSNGMQLEAIRVDKGGIALISMQDLHQGVKVIKVDGRLPGTPGYSLK